MFTSSDQRPAVPLVVTPEPWHGDDKWGVLPFGVGQSDELVARWGIEEAVYPLSVVTCYYTLHRSERAGTTDTPTDLLAAA